MQQQIKSKVEELIDLFIKNGEEQTKFIPGKSMVQYAGAIFDHKELLAILESLSHGWFGLAEKAHFFEQQFPSLVGCQYGSVVNSGSSANLLALAALKSKNSPIRLKEGDEVITTACGFPTTINPIIQNQLKPVFVDVDIGSYNANLDSVEKAISKKTKGIILAHTLGNSYDMNRLLSIIQRYNLFFIEDCCDAVGGKYNDNLLGSFGTFSTTSFYPAHHITLGEGGFVATNNEVLARIVKSLRDWGRACYCQGQASLSAKGACGRRFSRWLKDIPEKVDHKYIYGEIGYNLKPLELQCAMGLIQLTRLPMFIARRKDNFKFYYDMFKEWREYFYLPVWHTKADPSWFAFPLTVKPSAPFKRAQIVQWLEENKIQTRPIFAGNILRHPGYHKINCRVVGGLPNSDLTCTNSFFIGIYPGITNQKREYVAEKINIFLKKYK